MKKLILISLAILLTLPAMAQQKVQLPAPQKTGGMPLMEALSKRSTNRDMDGTKSLTRQQFSNMLWAAWGVNRSDGRRTAPSALNMQEIELYVVGRRATYLYNAQDHSLTQIAEGDHRAKINSQDYTKTCDYSIIMVADYTKMRGDDNQGKAVTSGTDAGFIAQNLYLFCASEGLANVTHGTLDQTQLTTLLRLPATKKLVLGHSVGVPK